MMSALTLLQRKKKGTAEMTMRMPAVIGLNEKSGVSPEMMPPRQSNIRMNDGTMARMAMTGPAGALKVGL